MAADSASDLAKAAEREVRRGDTLQAFLLYSRAAALEPSNLQYQRRRNELEAKPNFVQSAAPDLRGRKRPAG